MIELPALPAPNAVEVEAIDFGQLLRPAGGATPERVNRPGARLRLAISFAPMEIDTARVFNRRLMSARREGLRIDYPLLGLSQGAPGSPVIDGAEPTGRTLALRGLTPGYALKEGYPLTLVDGDDNRFLHFAGSAGRANDDGELTITGLEPPIRGVFADGDTVLLARPTFDGVPVENFGWSLDVDHLVRGATVMLEECTGLDPELGA